MQMSKTVRPRRGEGNKQLRGALAALIVAMVVVAAACSSDSPTSSSEATPPSTSTTAEPTTTTTAEDPEAVMARAQREWHTLVATELSDSTWSRDPVWGPGQRPTAASAAGGTSRIWDFDPLAGWGVAAQVELEGQTAAEAEAESVAVPDGEGARIVADGDGDDLRFLVPTYYGNGIAVAALGHVDGDWALLAFAGQGDETRYAMDAQISSDGGIVVWLNDCHPSCADGTVTEARAERTPDGYAIPTPPSPPPPPPPPSGREIIDGVSAELRRLADEQLGPSEEWTCDPPADPYVGSQIWCYHGSGPRIIVVAELIDLDGRFRWQIWGPEEMQ